jgi:spermidine/putrescine transport system substrate-binding protein
MVRCFKELMMILAITVFGFGCTRAVKSEAQQDKVLNLAIWSNYISPEIEKQFFETTGIKLQISNFSSNEELFAKIQAGGSGIDVAVPSDYMVGILAKLGHLEKINEALVPNRKLVAAEFLGLNFDAKNSFSYPYSSTTAGIAIRKGIIKKPLKTWTDVMNCPELSGQISLLDDAREVFAIALRANGFSINSTEETELRTAASWLKKYRKQIKVFRSDTVDILVNKEVLAAHSYSADALGAGLKTSGEIEYIIPEEGGSRAVDNLVIVKGSRRVEMAHTLINFLLRRESNIEFVKSRLGGPVIQGVREFLPKNIRDLSGLFLSEKTLSKLELLQDLGDTTVLIDRLWTEFKVQ